MLDFEDGEDDPYDQDFINETHQDYDDYTDYDLKNPPPPSEEEGEVEKRDSPPASPVRPIRPPVPPNSRKRKYREVPADAIFPFNEDDNEYDSAGELIPADLCWEEEVSISDDDEE
jgi:hypothetical protein